MRRLRVLEFTDPTGKPIWLAADHVARFSEEPIIRLPWWSKPKESYRYILMSSGHQYAVLEPRKVIEEKLLEYQD